MLSGNPAVANFHQLTSKKHSIVEICQYKLAIGASYDKSIVKDCGIHLVAYGFEGKNEHVDTCCNCVKQ